MSTIKTIDITQTANTVRKKPKKDKNILEDTPLRYVGYSDDLGETARVLCNKSSNFFVKNLPALSYIPVVAYIGTDVALTYKNAKKVDDKKTAAKKAMSKLIFQGLTSLLLPVALVKCTQKCVGKVFDKFVPALKEGVAKNGEKIPNRKRDIALALSGVAALIGFSKPIDKATDKIIMKKIINPILGLKEPKNSQKSGLGTTQA